MPPVEIESVIPRDVVTEEIETTKNNFQIVNKALELPLVSDAVSLAKSTISPLVDGVESYVSPIVETYVTPMAGQLEGQVTNLKSQAETALPDTITESIKTNVNTVVEQAKVAATSLDKLACGGLDVLTENVPLLKESTPDIKETAVSYVGFVSEYLASFTVAQVVLKLSDVGLSMTSTVLQKTGLDTKLPVGETINNVRRGARTVRRAGARRAGTSKPVSSIGEASFFGAVAEIVGLNFFLSVIGLQLVPRYKKTVKKVATFDVVTEETLDEQLAADNLADYDSDKDPDYAPSEASDDSLEYNSDAEKEQQVSGDLETKQEPIPVDAEVVESETEEVQSEAVDTEEAIEDVNVVDNESDADL